MSIYVFLSLFTVRNSSCGKVMFSQACVKNSVHGGGGGGGVHPLDRHPLGRYPSGQTPLGQTPPPRQTPSWANTPLPPPPVDPPGQTPPGQTHPLCRHPQADTSGVDTHSPLRDGHCSGRYASYWNAFLLFDKAKINKLCWQKRP